MTDTHAVVDLERELTQYVETALWSSHDENGEPMDRDYDIDDIAPEALASMREDLADFIESSDAAALNFWVDELGDGQIGHDFWLTRNGHGAGFWDRFSAGVGAAFGTYLTEQSKPYGASDLYVGDDGLVYES